ncbi:MAG: hypothetical protein KDB53_03905, partial [Planctomycetes bacterium]|nr:hypothetical protein [Planctomycetota bacterium]
MRDDAFHIPAEEREAIDQAFGAGAAVYGELTARGATQLVAALGAQDDDVFCDLGSGGGALVLQIARSTALRRALGIEISPTRHRVATRALQAEPELAGRVA